jgi:hypothetical protein
MEQPACTLLTYKGLLPRSLSRGGNMGGLPEDLTWLAHYFFAAVNHGITIFT